MSVPKTIAFIGASGGCGLSALRHALADNNTCIALCRTPSKLEAIFPQSSYPNLVIKQGNAHDLASTKPILVNPNNPSRFVDDIVLTIGSPLNLSKMSIEDPDVCKRAMSTLLAALAELRGQGIQGSPHISVISTTGISKHQRDVPLLMMPMYHILLKSTHEDKAVMEEQLQKSPEKWTLVRPSFLTDGESDKRIRVGVEDLVKGLESKAVGYVISREDVGRWMYQELVKGDGDVRYMHKAVSITY
jgi:putative NADH-flavin reductase